MDKPKLVPVGKREIQVDTPTPFPVFDANHTLLLCAGQTIQNDLQLESLHQIGLYRPVRWDSDHVILFDDELKEIGKELVRCNALGNVFIGLDFFDASINRISAWTVGMRNMEKALLFGMLMPHQALKKMQDEGNFTELMATLEEIKTYPFGDVWDHYCEIQGVPQKKDWFKEIKRYEQEVLSKR
mgnify:CR=1 FL=1